MGIVGPVSYRDHTPDVISPELDERSVLEMTLPEIYQQLSKSILNERVREFGRICAII